MGRMFSYFKNYRKPVAVGIVMKIIATMFLLLLPYIMEYLVDRVAPTRNAGLVLLWGGVMLLIAWAERLLNLGSNRLSVKATRGAIYEIRRDLFARALELSGSQLDRIGLPSLTARMTSDCYNVQGFLQTAQTFCFRAPILVLGSIGLTLTLDVRLSLVLCVITPIMVAAVALISFKGIPLYDRVQRRTDDVIRVLRENITGVRVVKALCREDYETARFTGESEALLRSDRRAGIIMSLPGPLTTLVLNVGLTVIVIIGARRVNSGEMQPGVILAFLTYFNMVLMGVTGLNRIFMMLSKANNSARRITEVLDQEPELPVLSADAAAQPEREGFIVFDHVSFRYGEDSGADGAAFAGEQRQMSLCDVSFSVAKGASVGIIGPTGCGKTTILSLLMRFYDPTEGHIYLNGRDLRTYDKSELRRRFGAVFQNDTLLSGTVAENIDFGRSLSEGALSAAIVDAQAGDFLTGDGGERAVAAHGVGLSGGQRQRVLLARALAGSPEILLLDDASSALDYRTDAALRQAIRDRHRDATLFVVAQRVSSIRSADEILVMDAGRVIGRGSHAALLEDCAQYREIYETQMGEGAEAV
ncbi:MAG: ABC transporter ATP-binding protein/permease [Oscillospiraceae bacterium]|nr:ABC transporter ATP-binding protein/permease [Oscillospiraceae bacterium]MCD8358259.1 ABC transporter ATP-binding protein/permease [Oscillospiraceae bacterium]